MYPGTKETRRQGDLIDHVSLLCRVYPLNLIFFRDELFRHHDAAAVLSVSTDLVPGTGYTVRVVPGLVDLKDHTAGRTVPGTEDREKRTDNCSPWPTTKGRHCCVTDTISQSLWREGIH